MQYHHLYICPDSVFACFYMQDRCKTKQAWTQINLCDVQTPPERSVSYYFAWFKGSSLSFLWISKDKNKHQRFCKTCKNSLLGISFSLVSYLIFYSILECFKNKGRSHWKRTVFPKITFTLNNWLRTLLQLAWRELIWHKWILSSAETVCPTYRDATAA